MQFESANYARTLHLIFRWENLEPLAALACAIGIAAIVLSIVLA